MRRAWPTLLTALTLACVTPPTPAGASTPPDGGPGTPAPQAPADRAAPTPPLPAQPPKAPEQPAKAPDAPSPAATTPVKAQAEPSCDNEWPDGRRFVILIVNERRMDDGKPLEPFIPADPMYPYEFRGDRYLFSEPGMIYKAMGRFEDKKDAEEALTRMEARRPGDMLSVTTPGPYLLPASPTCKLSRMARAKNPVIDSSSWILEKEGVLVAGTQTECKNGTLTKKVTVMSCDGMKNLFTDSSQHVCDRTRPVDTCVYSMEPGVLMFQHAYTLNGETTLRLRAHDVRKKKRLFTQDFTHGGALPGGAPDTAPATNLEDVDQDGIPELVDRVPETGNRTSVRKWRQGRFVDARSP